VAVIEDTINIIGCYELKSGVCVLSVKDGKKDYDDKLRNNYNFIRTN
jgi:hypothetical protein